MKKSKLVTLTSDEIAAIEAEITKFEQRVADHARRGREDGTYDHYRLSQLIHTREVLSHGEQELEGNNGKN